MTDAEQAYVEVTEKFTVLKGAVEDYFAAKNAYENAKHEEDCQDPLCPDRTNAHGILSPESLSTFVVCAEMTAITEHGAMTHTTRCFQGSAMACLGLLTDAQMSFVLDGRS